MVVGQFSSIVTLTCDLKSPAGVSLGRVTQQDGVPMFYRSALSPVTLVCVLSGAPFVPAPLGWPLHPLETPQCAQSLSIRTLLSQHRGCAEACVLEVPSSPRLLCVSKTLGAFLPLSLSFPSR